jgi:hypothetical protein
MRSTQQFSYEQEWTKGTNREDDDNSYYYYDFYIIVFVYLHCAVSVIGLVAVDSAHK